MNKIIETVSDTVTQLDAITALTSGGVILVITGIRTLWFFLKKRREARKARETVNATPPIIITSIELEPSEKTATDSYLNIITTLGDELAKLKAEVAELVTMKQENEHLKIEVERLTLENQKFQRKISRLTTKVNKLGATRKSGRLPI